ncbi:hypothetical protein CHLNCDRAFT_133670 [Chlorella variabilis]|uniref:CRAL-TRIO domain-containing protein n=1 Tax=Chlorella variabilis TaxID=554065 RepID=E1Z3J8_CHLVA|nr:hypothetical protein CHLNCDRAFT_133670 [Chlorella variabilis]EFN60174.1 hypothetical protein CHLNCDRAFT_133670 [Chlorella variabilis]|eukprot:XP_005852276.1 hypothetical protein CHLNCDRAFT_133670 [Chlorella variabilis]
MAPRWRSVGEPWPEDTAGTASTKRQRRRQADPPLLALRLGPFTAAYLVAAREPQLAELLAATGEATDAGFYARWLKARGGCPAAAADAVLAHAAWRREFVGAAAAEAAGEAGSGAGGALGIPEDSIADELAAGKVFLQGRDAAGCPVVVVKAARHDMGRRDLRRTKRLIAYVLDNACAAADPAAKPAGQICCLFDLSGLRPRNLDVKVLLAIFELLQQHYPERLNRRVLFFLNAPFLFWGVWRVVAPFVHAATRRKIHFVAGRGAARALAERIPPQVLPAEYGGGAELVPIDAAVAARRRQQQEQAAGGGASAAVSAAASASAGGLAGRQARAAAALRRRAGGALGAAGRFVSHKVARPVGGAAAGAARALRHHHAQLLRRGSGHGGGAQPGRQLPLSGQAQALLAQVVLRHVLLMGLLLRMLSRLVLRRAPPAPSPSAAAGGGKSTAPCPAADGDGCGGEQGAASPAGPPGAEAAAAEPAGAAGPQA